MSNEKPPCKIMSSNYKWPPAAFILHTFSCSYSLVFTRQLLLHWDCNEDLVAGQILREVQCILHFYSTPPSLWQVAASRCSCIATLGHPGHHMGSQGCFPSPCVLWLLMDLLHWKSIWLLIESTGYPGLNQNRCFTSKWVNKCVLKNERKLAKIENPCASYRTG